MNTDNMNVAKWVKIFEATGLDPKTMEKWHKEFERLYPDGHQAFLAWLGLDPSKIREIRAKSV